MSDNTINNDIHREESKVKNFLTINDLREKDYGDFSLTPQERLALKNFDRYRITELNNQKSENQFHNKYMQLQVMANLSPYQEFLKECYFF
jgi:hypothetical protein